MQPLRSMDLTGAWAATGLHVLADGAVGFPLWLHDALFTLRLQHKLKQASVAGANEPGQELSWFPYRVVSLPTSLPSSHGQRWFLESTVGNPGVHHIGPTISTPGITPLLPCFIIHTLSSLSSPTESLAYDLNVPSMIHCCPSNRVRTPVSLSYRGQFPVSSTFIINSHGGWSAME